MTADAVVPLFVASMKAMYELVRLSGADKDLQGTARPIVISAVTRARVTIYERLGSVQVGQILSVVEVSNPTTDGELLRSRASLLEADLVMRQLVQDLPVLFVENSSGTGAEVWNEEQLTRDSERLSQLMQQLDARIEEAFALLDSDSETAPGAQADSLGPVAGAVCPEPGGSVFHRPHNIWLRPTEGRAGHSGINADTF